MRHRSLFRAGLLVALTLAFATSASAQDADGDGVSDAFDNCINAANGPTIPDLGGNSQRDADQDSYGNACDCDFDQSLTCGIDDFNLFLPDFVAGTDSGVGTDMDGDGRVGIGDFNRFLPGFIAGIPGPTCCEDGFPPLPFDGVVCDGNLPTSECTVTVQGIPFVTTREKIVVLEQGGGVFAASAAVGDAIVVSDDIRISTPFGEIALVEAIMTFTVGPGGGFDTITGTVRVPFPDLGFMAGVQIDETPMATVGIDLGANIDLGIPLLPNVHYLFFNFSGNFGASLGPVSFDAGGPDATLVMNPDDPFIFVGGSLGGLLPEGDGAAAQQFAALAFVEPDLGFGISLGAMIPFEPNPSCLCDHDPRTIGGPLDATCNACVADICAVDTSCCSSGWDALCVAEIDTVCGGSAAQFLGHLMIKAPIPLGTLPLTLNGLAVANIDPEMDGTIFQLSPDLQLGGNGTVDVGIPFLQFLEFGFELGNASASIEYVENDVWACFSGELDPGDPFAMFPPQFPIPIKQSPQQVGASVKGAFSTANAASNFVRAEGEFSIDLGPIGQPIGVNLGELASSSVQLDIDQEGLLFSGMTQTQIVPNFTNAEMSLAVQIPAQDALQASAELNGALTVAGLGLDPARIFISPLGFEVEGNLDLAPVAVLMVSGGVDASGVMLTGNFDSNISFNLQATIDDILFEAQLAVSIAQDALDEVEGLIAGCKDLCGDCYLNPCCPACDVTFEAARLAAEAALFLAEEALGAVQAAVTVFFDALPFPIAGTITAHVDVTIDNLDVSGAVSASLNGIVLSGSAQFFPPQVCVALPLGSFPGADVLGLGNVDFCLPPF